MAEKTSAALVLVLNELVITNNNNKIFLQKVV